MTSSRPDSLVPAESAAHGHRAGVATKLRLSDRLTATSGRHDVPGMQALVRLPLDVGLPEQIRGHEDVKAGNAAAARTRAEQLLADLQRPRLNVTPTAGTRA